jgi:multidrug efflux pump subunit AcrB
MAKRAKRDTGANIPEAVAEVTAIMQGVLRVLPPGITPPVIIQYSASDVPILQAVVYSDTLSEDRLNDYSNQFIRTQLATVQGASVPLAYGRETSWSISTRSACLQRTYLRRT